MLDARATTIDFVSMFAGITLDFNGRSKSAAVISQRPLWTKADIHVLFGTSAITCRGGAVADPGQVHGLVGRSRYAEKSPAVRLNLKCNLKPSMRGIIQRRIMRLQDHDIIIRIKFQAELPNAS